MGGRQLQRICREQAFGDGFHRGDNLPGSGGEADIHAVHRIV